MLAVAASRPEQPRPGVVTRSKSGRSLTRPRPGLLSWPATAHRCARKGVYR